MDYSLTVITFCAENRLIRFSQELDYTESDTIKHFDAEPVSSNR